MQEMFLIYIETRSQMLFIELYIEFEQSKANQNIESKDYNIDSLEEFESNYEVVDPDEDEDQVDNTLKSYVSEVVNTLANQHLFEVPSFICILDLEAMHALKFPKYMNVEPPVMVDSKFVVRMKFSFREIVIMAIKDCIICRGVDYRVYESKLVTFYAKCTQYDTSYNWLIETSIMHKTYCWEIKRYNSNHN
ncbi:hypothetical protein Ahy_A07g032435 [Arachis hypogaea]|uniref:Transposase MuDR plant domain-containing protein n=1 Tax=Arachis hypogaea TaxID=3818 RepID=A0A445C6T2_ARAHY|nr:hypothetical protein Ahy_A07g032435 [Arachis hypogaea]